MSERPLAYYDDLGLVPDEDFAFALRRQLDEQMATPHHPTANGPTEEVQDMTLTTTPPDLGTPRSRSRRRWIVAAAAAAVIVVGVGVYLAGDDGDGAVVTPVDTVPTTVSIAPPEPITPATEAPPATTVPEDAAEDRPAFAYTDQQIARALLLPVGEYHTDRAFPTFFDVSVAMDGSIASSLAECTGYELVFESPDRPARIATRAFRRDEELSLQYAVVLPDETLAHSVYEILADPEFWATCGVAYSRIEPGANAGDSDARQFSRSISDASETIDPPQLEPVGDESKTLAVRNELGPVYFSVVRVGRAVVTLETAGQRDVEGGTTIFTPDQIQAALDAIVERAHDALAADGAAAEVDDEFRARSVLLDNTDFDFRDFDASITFPVRMDGDVAAQLPACEPFVDTVFETDRRPATIAYETFYSVSIPAVMANYVVVHPSDAQAAAMLDGMQDPAFKDECVPAYNTTLPVRPADIEYWFPFFVGEELPAPEIDVDADDVLLRRYTDTWTDDEGVVHGPEEFAYAAIRVGRIVASIEVELEDTNGAQVTSLEQFEEIVQTLAARAAAAQQ